MTDEKFNKDSTFLGLIACSTKRSELKDEEFAHLLNIDLEDANDKMSESDFLSRVDYIPLKGTLIGEINKILFHHDRIYVGDHLQDKIIWFDMQGNFINMIDSIGRGPGEYLEYVDFTIDTDNDLLIVSDDFRYHVYDLDGTFKKRYNAPTQALRFEYFSGGYLLDTGMDADSSADIDVQLTSTILLDANFRVQSGYFPFDQDLSAPEYPKSNQYFTMQGKPIINKLFSNDYFVLEKDFKPTPAYRFNFGSKNIPQSIYHPDSYFEIRNTIQKYGLVGSAAYGYVPVGVILIPRYHHHLAVPELFLILIISCHASSMTFPLPYGICCITKRKRGAILQVLRKIEHTLLKPAR